MTPIAFIIIGFLLAWNGTNGADDNLLAIYQDINKYYDSFRPPLSVNYAGQVIAPIKASNYHSKRCSHADPGSAIQRFQTNTYDAYSKEVPVLVGSPCLFSDSLGNWLSNYFETILCANAAGMHYMAVAKIWEPGSNDTASPFLSKLPSIVEHKSPTSVSFAKKNINMHCPCSAVCHERPIALWTKRRDIIHPLMWEALNYHKITLKTTRTVILESDASNRPPGTDLPLIPDVAIHYRCGDNFVGHYGFLPFSAFKSYVPADASTIFVLAEKRSRKTAQKAHRAAKCDAIFSELFNYLTSHFPRAAVLIRRGDDLYLDLLRLASARTTICSVSSFCLWPAFVSNHTAYFPATKLIVRHDTSLDLGFKWISKPEVVLGAAFDHAPAAALIGKLTTL